jgi:hypothetical protein
MDGCSKKGLAYLSGNVADFLHLAEAFDFAAFVCQEKLKCFKSDKPELSEAAESTISK